MRKRVSKLVKVPSTMNRSYEGVTVTFNFPCYTKARRGAFKGGPFPHFKLVGSSKIHFYGKRKLRLRQRRIKVDAVVNSPGPNGKIVNTKWTR